MLQSINLVHNYWDILHVLFQHRSSEIIGAKTLLHNKPSEIICAKDNTHNRQNTSQKLCAFFMLCCSLILVDPCTITALVLGFSCDYSSASETMLNDMDKIITLISNRLDMNCVTKVKYHWIISHTIPNYFHRSLSCLKIQILIFPRTNNASLLIGPLWTNFKEFFALSSNIFLSKITHLFSSQIIAHQANAICCVCSQI